jgi:hypothetical protein
MAKCIRDRVRLQAIRHASGRLVFTLSVPVRFARDNAALFKKGAEWRVALVGKRLVYEKAED